MPGSEPNREQDSNRQRPPGRPKVDAADLDQQPSQEGGGPDAQRVVTRGEEFGKADGGHGAYDRAQEVVSMVSSRGGKYGFVYRSRHKAYRGIRRSGLSKSSAARISNAGRTHIARSRMAKKGARTRSYRGGH